MGSSVTGPTPFKYKENVTSLSTRKCSPERRGTRQIDDAPRGPVYACRLCHGSAKLWQSVLAEAKHRGVADVCILCFDGLKGLPDAVAATWPQAVVQSCVVHLVRASLRYAFTSTGRRSAPRLLGRFRRRADARPSLPATRGLAP